MIDGVIDCKPGVLIGQTATCIAKKAPEGHCRYHA
jgi:hypothetical protein